VFGANPFYFGKGLRVTFFQNWGLEPFLGVFLKRGNILGFERDFGGGEKLSL